MNAVKSTWSQLVSRRLWPVAILLVAALAAVPFLLAKQPEVPVPPVVSTDNLTTEADDAIAEPVVAEVLPEDRSRRRRLLGQRKDPFRPAPPAKKAKAEGKDSEQQQSDSKPQQPSGGDEKPAESGGGGGSSAPAPAPAPAEPVAPKKYFSPGTIIVRFSDPNSGQAAKFAIKKLQPVPDDELPLLVYMGLTKDGKRAKFLVDASVEVDGDGKCRPHPSNCETVELAVGETEFLDVIDPEAPEDADAEDRIAAQFQLDLVDIKRKGDADVK
jgi:hypothetical protein